MRKKQNRLGDNNKNTAGGARSLNCTQYQGRLEQQKKYFYRVARTRSPTLLGNDVGRTGALLALLYVEGYGLSFSQRLESTALNSAVVNKDVFGAVGRCDEAEAFLIAEPLNCACCHFCYLW